MAAGGGVWSHIAFCIAQGAVIAGGGCGAVLLAD